jgi:hypothetical protein
MLVAIAAITGWALITLYRMNIAAQAREHVHRERLAMIERGLVPPPEADPGQFERMMDWHPSRGTEMRADHSRRVGIILVALSIGFGVMMYFLNDDIRRGVGVGALLFLIGVAFLVNAMFEARSARNQPPPTPPGTSRS